jgi:hypothetical protein
LIETACVKVLYSDLYLFQVIFHEGRRAGVKDNNAVAQKEAYDGPARRILCFAAAPPTTGQGVSLADLAEEALTMADERPIPITASIGALAPVLLAGEDPGTRYAGDAAHWMNIYRELIAFHEDVLARNQSDGDGFSDDQRHLTALTFDPLETMAVLEHYRARLDFWYDRHWQLQGLAIDPKTYMATHRENMVHLTRREYQLLSHLLAYPGETFAASVLAQRAWSGSRLSTDQVRIYVARLRRRLADLGLPCQIVSVPRRGYSLVCE